jgi:hypothetical protein
MSVPTREPMPEPAEPRRPDGWKFDFGAADAAVNELTKTAQSLLQVAVLMETDIPTITDGWRGRFREVFDVDSAKADIAARILADDLLALAAAIRAGSIEASTAWVYD